MIITIDGPVSSGKSSAAKTLAKELKIYYLNTGLLYRAMTYIFLKILNIKPKDISAKDFDLHVQNIKPENLNFVKDIVYDFGNNKAYVFYNKENITSKLHDANIDILTAIMASNKNVRDSLVKLQRDLAKKHNLVADGRDLGSIVYPDADYKFYITANIETRAQRMMMDKARPNVSNDIEQAKKEIRERDKRDEERKISPLTVPENAILIDNSKLNLQETVDHMMRHIEK